LETITFDSPPEIRLKFEVRFFHAAEKFLFSLHEKHQRKLIYNIEQAQVNRDPKLFKKIEGDIWEFRANCAGIQYRFLAFWFEQDKQKPQVFITHGFVKKTSKIPSSEIDRAIQIRRQHFNSLNNQQ
jgi:phage-related protein